MSNLEVHLIKVSDAYESQSTVGHVHGSSFSFKGTGGGSVSGRTDTIHSSEFIAGNRTYRLKTANQSIRFRNDDLVVCVVKPQKSSGIFEIAGFVNLSSQSRHIPGYGLPAALFILGILTIPVFGLGLILIILTLASLPQISKIRQYLSNFQDIDPEQGEAVLSNLDGVKTKSVL